MLQIGGIRSFGGSYKYLNNKTTVQFHHGNTLDNSTIPLLLKAERLNFHRVKCDHKLLIYGLLFTFFSEHIKIY